MSGLRNKLIKIIAACLLPALLLLFLTAAASSASEARVYDQAALFTEQEKAHLEQRIGAIRAELSLDPVIVTVDDTGGKSSRDYADDFYDEGGFGMGAERDGLLLLINMESREVYISTSGAAIDIFTDARIESILDAITPALSMGAYYDAGAVFLDELAFYGRAGIPEGQYRVDESDLTFGGRFKKSLARSPLYVLISMALAAIAVGIMAARNRGLVKTSAFTYLDQDSFTVLASHDHLMNTHISKTRIQSSSGGGGRSTTHRSSSGRIHGGGGRRF
mgnify:CR=1 FL=1|jgi:uncharacterized protein